MKTIENLIIKGFVFELNDNTQECKIEGDIIPQYCKIIPFQDEKGELAIRINIAIEKIKGKEQECKISIYESNTYPGSLCLEDVVFYTIYTNNIDGKLEEWHIFIHR